jgi:hypothetical protein
MVLTPLFELFTVTTEQTLAFTQAISSFLFKTATHKFMAIITQTQTTIMSRIPTITRIFTLINAQTTRLIKTNRKILSAITHSVASILRKGIKKTPTFTQTQSLNIIKYLGKKFSVQISEVITLSSLKPFIKIISIVPPFSWVTHAAVEPNTWESIAFGNDMFVAIASTGSHRVMVSGNGVDWTPADAAEANSWKSVTFGAGKFVAVSSDGINRVMTSTDGVTWTPHLAAEQNTWDSITYGNNQFVAVSSDGINRVMTSTDGVTWSPQTAAENNLWQSVTYGNGQYIAIAS